MNFVLSEEHQILRDSAHDFFRERMPVSALRHLRDTRDERGYDAVAWEEMADMGWAGILLPEAYGGVDFGYRGAGQILEAGGRTLAASPIMSTSIMAAPLIARIAPEAMKQSILEPVALGKKVLALALEESGRHGAGAIQTAASLEGEDFRLSGRKQFVLDGHVANELVVIAQLDGTNNLAAFLVDAHADGVRIQRNSMVDSRNCAAVEFNEVALSASTLIGQGGALEDALGFILDGARACVAAEMLGAGLEAFERTIAYMKVRQQFDQPIGSFQALKHRAALMFCEIELATSTVANALSAMDSASDDRASVVSLAKAKTGEMLELVTNEAVQLHGGIGMTDDEEIGLFLKRARVQEQLLGDASFHRARYAEALGI